MATVRQTLALNDRVSPVLSKIINAMNNTLDIMEQVNVATERGIGAGAFAKARNQIKSANVALDELLNDTNEVNTAAKKAGNGFAGWQAAIVTANQGIQLIQQGMQGINRLTGFLDGLTGISARLNLITEDHLGLQDKIFAAAQRSRGEYAAMASTVAKLNLLAANAFQPFGGEDAVVSFTETLNKAFVISGAGTQERESAMYQMAQALSSGRLQGDEYRSIIENAPLVARSIEDYMRNVKGAQGTMKDWSSEGLLTSDVIIAAVQNASAEINSQFADMPMKFSDHMTKLKNEGIKALAPLTTRFETLMQSDKFEGFINTAIQWVQAGIAWIDKMIDKIEAIGSTSGFQSMASDIGNALGIVLTVLGWIINAALWVVNIFTSQWSWIGPIVWGIVAALIAYAAYTAIANTVTAIGTGIKIASAIASFLFAAATGGQASATAKATAEQYKLNAAMLGSPVTWIILALIALIVIFYVIINTINKVTGSSLSATGMIVGALSAAVAFIWNLFLGLVDLVLAIVNYWYNLFGAFVNFFGNVFNDPIGSIIQLFGQLADNVLGVLENIAKAMDKVFGSNMASTVAGWRASLSSKIDIATKQYGNGSYEKVMDNLNLSSESLGLSRWAYEDAYNWGYDKGEQLEASMGSIMDSVLGGFDPTAGPGGTNLEDYTGSGGNSLNVDTGGSEVSLSDDDIKYLRDIAKLEYVNQYTTLRPVVQAQFGDIHETADVNEIITVLEDAIEGAYASSLGKG